MNGLNHLLNELMQRAAAGPVHRFTFTPSRTQRGRDIEKLLLEHGIPVFARRREPAGDLSFAVRASQALYAEYLLCRSQAPLTTPLLDEAHAALLEAEETDDRTLLARLLDALLRLAD